VAGFNHHLPKLAKPDCIWTVNKLVSIITWGGLHYAEFLALSKTRSEAPFTLNAA
jgi:hypothetical protein